MIGPKWIFVAALFAAMAAHGANAAQLGSITRGEAMALEICSDCHVVSDKQVRVNLVGLPSFREVANNPEKSEFWIRTFLRTPHFEMPNFVFTDDQLDHLVAYIGSLNE